jgi:O-antigen ligase
MGAGLGLPERPRQQVVGTWRRAVDSHWFPFLQLASVMAAWALWNLDASRGWVLLIALAPPALRVLAGRWPVRRTPLDVPLGIFLVTACVGVWAAYDRDGSLSGFADPRPAGWQALWGLCLAALAFYAVAAMKTRAQSRWALALLAGFGAALVGWFSATNDWETVPAKWAFSLWLGRAIQSLLPELPGPRLHPNIAGGIIAPLFPLSLGLVAETFRREGGKWAWAAWGAVTGAAMAVGLVLTTTRGAWLGVVGAWAAGLCWSLLGRLNPKLQRPGAFIGLLALVGLAGVVLFASSSALRQALLGVETLAGRYALLQEALLLMRDYPFTGCGLGAFGAVHSTYALMIHVPFQSHAHALLLDVALEQGVPGALAAIGVLGGAAWLGLRALAQGTGRQPALAASMLSLAAMGIHGLVDDPFYGSRGVWLLWVPAGLVLATLGEAEVGERVLRWVRTLDRRVVIGLALAALALLGVSVRPTLEALYANLGAVYQTQVELRAYDVKHRSRTLDQVRQEADLARAEAFFARSLALHPMQVTARTRLAAVALSRGQYEVALMHAQAAWNAGHRDRVTRLMLGDALVASGRPAEAVQAVRSLSWAEERLQGQAQARYWASGDYQRAADAWRAVTLLDPNDVGAASRIKEAEERVKRP